MNVYLKIKNRVFYLRCEYVIVIVCWISAALSLRASYNRSEVEY